MLPAAAGFAVFSVWPAISGFHFSLTDYALLGPAEFVGLDNYQQMSRPSGACTTKTP